MATTPLHLIPPNYTGGPAQQSPQETSPSGALPNSGAQILLERNEIDKSLKSLENVLSLLYDYAQLWQNVVSLDKKLVKAFKEAGGMKRSGFPDGVEWPNNVFLACSLIFDSVNEVDAKYSKLVEREYESCNQELKKWLKKLKKEDKALDEYTAAANAKIKAAGQAYEKKSKRGITSSPSGTSLDSYSSLLSTLSTSVSNAKHQHTLFISTRHLSTLYLFSGAAGRIADAQWMKTAELLRRASPHIGPLGEGRSYVEGGWKGGNVVDLPLNLPVEQSGEGTIRAAPREVAPATTTGLPLSMPIPTPASEQPTRVPASDVSYKGTASTEMLERITRELQGSLPLPEIPSATKTNPPNPIKEREITKTEVKENNEPKPPASIPKEERTEDKPIKSDNNSAPTPAPAPPPAPTTMPEANMTSSSGTTNTTRSGDTISSASTSAKDTSSISSTPKQDASKQQLESRPPRMPTPPSISHAVSGNEKALFEPAHTLARTPINTDKREDPRSAASPPQVSPTALASVSPRSPGPGSYFPSRPPPDAGPGVVRPIPRSNIPNSSSPIVGSPPPPMPQAQIPGAYPAAGKGVGRTMSIDSTASHGSLVAAMRDRYDSASPPPPSSSSNRPGQGWRESYRNDRMEGYRDSFGRDRPDPYAKEREFLREREGGKVSDMASRFTPIEGPLPQPAVNATYNNSTFSMGGDARYPHARPPYSSNSSGGDSLPIRTPLKRSSVDEFGSSFAGIGTGRRGAETMPLERRPGVSTPISSAPIPGNNLGASNDYDLHMSELELQQREMELEIHRQRLQLAKEREAIIRERGYQGANPGSGEYESLREAQRRGNMDDDRYGGGGYGSGREREKDDGYGRSPYPAAGPAPASYNNDWSYDYPRPPPIGTPRLNSDRSFPRHPDRDRDERGVDMSTGLGVMGLGLPPGAAPASRSRESLSVSMAGRSSAEVSSSTHRDGPSSSRGMDSDNERRPRVVEPRRSADTVNSNNSATSPTARGGGAVGKDRDKGGTWLGKGLRRLSMPLGAGNTGA